MSNVYTPVNGTPTNIKLGTDDKSIRPPIYEESPRAIHLPFSPLYTQWGPEEPQLTHGQSRDFLYGSKTFDPLSKFFNHQTMFVNKMFKEGNPVMIKRILPSDAPAPANIRISIDVLPKQLDEIERMPDGSFRLNQDNGNPVTTSSKVSGYVIKFVKEYIEPDNLDKSSKVGKGTQATGDQSDSGQSSTRYPLFDFEVPFRGSKGNDFGFSIWAPTVNDALGANQQLLNNEKVYPYRISMLERYPNTSTPRLIENDFGEISTEFVLKPGLIDSVNEVRRYMGEVVLRNYQDLNPPPGYPRRFGPFKRLHVYQENIETVLKLFYESEKTQNYTQNELKAVKSDTPHHMVNLFGAQSSMGVPYQTVRFAEPSANSIRLTENTRIYAEGGGDGTLSLDEYEALTAKELNRFSDPNDIYQDTITYPCAYFWDSGFKMKTKYELTKFISYRKDTFIFLTTHVDGDKALSMSDESARAVALQQRARAYPDSQYYGTAAFRYAVITGSGIEVNERGDHRIPVSYDFLGKICRLANSDNLKEEFLFNRYEGNRIVKDVQDINNTWAPYLVRVKQWENGVMWVSRTDERTFGYSATPTGYPNDTSVLKGILPAMIIANIQRESDFIHKRISGGRYSQLELKQAVEEAVVERLQHKYAGEVTLVPNVYFTALDNNNGYSWHLDIEAFFDKEYTVQTVTVRARRASDLPQGVGFVA